MNRVNSLVHDSTVDHVFLDDEFGLINKLINFTLIYDKNKYRGISIRS